MAESQFFDKAERVDLSNTPLQCDVGVERTRGGERNYLDVKLTEDYSVWGALAPDKTEAWIEQINLRAGVEDPRIAERLLKGFAVAAYSAGARLLRMPSAAPSDLYLLARVFGEENLAFYDTHAGEEATLDPMTLDQALDSIDRIQQVEESEPYPLIGYFDVSVGLTSVETNDWEVPTIAGKHTT